MRGESRITAAWALAAAIVAGCGEEGPRLVPVTGTVTINNKPLGDAEISFVPDPSNKDVTPGADITGPEGNFKVSHGGRAGLAPGRYQVLISKKETAPNGLVLPEAIKVDRIQQEMSGIRRESLPKRYSDATSSTEYVEVKEDGKNDFQFDVKASATKKK